MTNIHKITNEKGLVLRISYDSELESPREWGTLSKMVCFHNRYNLGDSHDYRHQNYDSWEGMKKQIEKDNDVSVILPLYLYDHSGVTISTEPFNCRWDSGQVGWIFASKEDIRKRFGVTNVTKKSRDKAVQLILSELNVYDKYINGEVYQYLAEDSDGNIVDACSGFYNISDMEDNLPEEFRPLLKEAI